MNPLEAERNTLLVQVLAARTLETIAAAERVLDDWIEAHPEELGMRDAFEILENRKEVLEAHAREEMELVKAV